MAIAKEHRQNRAQLVGARGVRTEQSRARPPSAASVVRRTGRARRVATAASPAAARPEPELAGATAFYELVRCPRRVGPARTCLGRPLVRDSWP